MLIRLDDKLEIIKGGKKYEFHAGDVIQTSRFPEAEKLIKAQKSKGRIEK